VYIRELSSQREACGGSSSLAGSAAISSDDDDCVRSCQVTVERDYRTEIHARRRMLVSSAAGEFNAFETEPPLPPLRSNSETYLDTFQIT